MRKSNFSNFHKGPDRVSSGPISACLKIKLGGRIPVYQQVKRFKFWAVSSGPARVILAEFSIIKICQFFHFTNFLAFILYHRSERQVAKYVSQ